MPDQIISDQTQVASPPPTFPEIADIPAMPQASGPTDIPPMITQPKIPKKKSGRMIATILGIFLLVGAVGAGVILVGQKQLFQQKAVVLPCSEVGTCYPNTYTCANKYGQLDCRNGQVCGVGCYLSTICTSGDKKSCTTTQNCPGEFVCGNDGKWSTVCYDIADNCPSRLCTEDDSRHANCTQQLDGQACPGKKLEICKNGAWGGGYPCLDIADDCPSTQQNCSEVCVTDHPDGGPYCNTGGYLCQNYIGDWAKLKSCFASGSCSAPYSYPSGNYCVDTSRNCTPNPGCSTTPDTSCAGGTPTTPPGDTSTTTTSTPTAPPTTPTAPPGTAQCVAVKAYDTSWNLLTQVQLSALSAGDIVRFTVSGNPAGQIDKARFTINGVLEPEVITKKPGTDEYYTEYTIPAGVTSFTVTAQVHHLTLGWF